MKVYNKEDFLLDNIDNTLSIYITELETLEFKYNTLNDQVLSIKKDLFHNLFLYEQMKINNKTIIPDKIVLSQYKLLEKDENYLRIKREINNYKIKINNINKIINDKRKYLNSLFKFDQLNYLKYIDIFTIFLENEDDVVLDSLFEEIFNNEFLDKDLYYDIKWTRNYDVFNLIVEQAPEEMRTIMQYIIDYRYIKDVQFDNNFIPIIEENPMLDRMYEYEYQFNKRAS